MRLGQGAHDGLTILAVAAGYYGCAVVGTVLSVPPSGFAIIWPATAFLISVMLLMPPRRWWTCVAGVVPTHFLMAGAFQPHAPFVVMTTQVAGNLLLASTTVLAVRRVMRTPPDFDNFRSVAMFILVAGVAVPAIVNALILAAHVATGWVEDFWLSWRQWMIAGIFPTVTLPLLVVLALKGEVTGRPAASPHARRELVLVSLLLFAQSFLAFGGAVDATHWPAVFLTPLPLLLWAAVRLGVGGTSAALLTLAAAIIARALSGQGPFAAHAPIEDVISLQVFLTSISIPLLLLAALVDERRRTADLLRLSENRMQLTAAATDLGFWQWDQGRKQLWLTEHCRAMFGLETASTPGDFLALVHPEERARVQSLLEPASSSGTTRSTYEFRVHSNGHTRWFSLLTHNEFDDAGRPTRISGVFRDVSDRIGAIQEADRLRLLMLRLQDDERRRIAEELHDSTAQHLVAAHLNLIQLKSRTEGETLDFVQEIMRSIGEATSEIRTFAYLLHPPQLDSEGLISVLGQYVPGFQRRTGVRTRLRVHPIADRLPADLQHALLRITQESLGNIHRHARAKHAWVSLRYLRGNVHLVIRDDGRGIRPEAGEQLGERLRLGVGIPAMTARVRQLGGRIDVNARSKGTTIHVAIPVDRDGTGGPIVTHPAGPS